MHGHDERVEVGHRDVHAADQMLTVTLAGDGSDTVTSSPVGSAAGRHCTDAYAPNTDVTLTASPTRIGVHRVELG